MFSSYVLSTNQRGRSRFVRSLTNMAEIEGSFEERFSETVRQPPLIYDIR